MVTTCPKAMFSVTVTIINCSLVKLRSILFWVWSYDRLVSVCFHHHVGAEDGETLESFNTRAILFLLSYIPQAYNIW